MVAHERDSTQFSSTSCPLKRLIGTNMDRKVPLKNREKFKMYIITLTILVSATGFYKKTTQIWRKKGKTLHFISFDETTWSLWMRSSMFLRASSWRSRLRMAFGRTEGRWPKRCGLAPATAAAAAAAATAAEGPATACRPRKMRTIDLIFKCITDSTVRTEFFFPRYDYDVKANENARRVNAQYGLSRWKMNGNTIRENRGAGRSKQKTHDKIDAKIKRRGTSSGGWRCADAGSTAGVGGNGWCWRRRRWPCRPLILGSSILRLRKTNQAFSFIFVTLKKYTLHLSLMVVISWSFISSGHTHFLGETVFSKRGWHSSRPVGPSRIAEQNQ